MHINLKGSGPACSLASTNTPAGIILMSPYTSIKDVADDLVTGYLSWVVKDRFRNIDIISKIKSPILLIHGKSDTLIKFEHS